MGGRWLILGGHVLAGFWGDDLMHWQVMVATIG